LTSAYAAGALTPRAERIDDCFIVDSLLDTAAMKPIARAAATSMPWSRACFRCGGVEHDF
jgi:hypothetical protein